MSFRVNSSEYTQDMLHPPSEQHDLRGRVHTPEPQAPASAEAEVDRIWRAVMGGVAVNRRGFFATLAGALWFAVTVRTSEAAASRVKFSGTTKRGPTFKRVWPVYAREGDLITCERGHSIATFKREVKVGEMFDSEAISAWQQTEPAIGTMEQPCEVCGSRWFRGELLHFWDGWRIA